MDKEFENKRYTTLVKTKEITNCITGEQNKFPNEYFVYDNIKKCEVFIPNFKPMSYQEIKDKAIELNNKIENNMKKVAKLVYVSLLTRVVVNENATDEEIMETAKPKLIDKIKQEGLENLEEIVDDTEVPYDRIRDKYDLEQNE